MSEDLWPMLVEWTVRIGSMLAAGAWAGRRRPLDQALANASKHLPPGGELGGVLPDGTVWYLRAPAASGGGDRHGR